MKTVTLFFSLFAAVGIATAQPAKPTLNLPSDNATAVPVQDITLDWDTVACDSFHVRLSATSDFSANVWEAYVSVSEYEVAGALNYLTDYFWTVAGIDSNGTGEWSDTFRFTTIQPPPATPTLTSPRSASINTSLTPTLEWDPSATATSYEVLVSTYGNFADTSFIGTTSSTSITVNPKLDPYIVYYWKVAAINATGRSEFSPYWNFTTLYTGLEEINAEAMKLRVFPNPAVGHLQISFESTAGQVAVQLLDLQGRVVLSKQSEAVQGLHNETFELSGVKAGMYFLRVEQNGQYASVKVAVQ